MVNIQPQAVNTKKRRGKFFEDDAICRYCVNFVGCLAWNDCQHEYFKDAEIEWRIWLIELKRACKAWSQIIPRTTGEAFNKWFTYEAIGATCWWTFWGWWIENLKNSAWNTSHCWRLNHVETCLTLSAWIWWIADFTVGYTNATWVAVWVIKFP